MAVLFTVFGTLGLELCERKILLGWLELEAVTEMCEKELLLEAVTGMCDKELL